jgi:hypothetical protein
MQNLRIAPGSVLDTVRSHSVGDLLYRFDSWFNHNAGLSSLGRSLLSFSTSEMNFRLDCNSMVRVSSRDGDS